VEIRVRVALLVLDAHRDVGLVYPESVGDEDVSVLRLEELVGLHVLDGPVEPVARHLEEPVELVVEK
jgi:hypothetical protein